MKRYDHEDREAVAACRRRGRALCGACASGGSPGLCEERARLLWAFRFRQRPATALRRI